MQTNDTLLLLFFRSLSLIPPSKKRDACVIEANESTRTLTGKTQPRGREYVTAEKELNSLSHYKLVQKACSYTPSNEDSGWESRS